jgi:hypothetical protein
VVISEDGDDDRRGIDAEHGAEHEIEADKLQMPSTKLSIVFSLSEAREVPVVSRRGKLLSRTSA